MPYILVRHKVKDYDEWRPKFDNHEARKAGGSKGGRMFRTADDPNQMVVLMEWDNLDSAMAFAQSEDLREAMEKAGIIDQPDVYFLEEIGSFDA
jgi:heme-degrading monooxygenase HmoA